MSAKLTPPLPPAGMISRAEAANVVANVLPALMPFMERFDFSVHIGRATKAAVHFTGPVGKPELDRLIRHLEVLKETLPDEGTILTPEDVKQTIIAALADTSTEREGDGHG